jgi:hypothetical protein
MAKKSVTGSQLVLRSSGQQIVIGSPLHPEVLASVVEEALEKRVGFGRLEQTWGQMCVRLAQQSEPSDSFTLSIPTSADLPTVWVSELGPHRFSIASSLNGDYQWKIISRDGSELELVTSSAA